MGASKRKRSGRDRGVCKPNRGKRARDDDEIDGGATAREIFAYDDNGNLIFWVSSPSGIARSLTWDALDRLVQVTGGVTAAYAYDPFGRRIERREGAVTTAYQYDGLAIVAEYTKTTSPTVSYALEASFVHGPGLDAPSSGSGTSAASAPVRLGTQWRREAERDRFAEFWTTAGWEPRARARLRELRSTAAVRARIGCDRQP